MIEKEGIDLNKDKDISYSGLVFYLNDDGKKKGEGTLKDGEMISGKKWNKDGSVKE